MEDSGSSQSKPCSPNVERANIDREIGAGHVYPPIPTKAELLSRLFYPEEYGFIASLPHGIIQTICMPTHPTKSKHMNKRNACQDGTCNICTIAKRVSRRMILLLMQLLLAIYSTIFSARVSSPLASQASPKRSFSLQTVDLLLNNNIHM